MNRLNFPFFKLPIKNNENKKFIFDFIRKKWVALTPEEWVRQNTISYLIESKKYPKSRLKVEGEITLNSIKKRYDIIAFDKKIPEKLTEQKFYTEIQKAYDPKSKVFLGTNDNKQGKKFIDDAVHSSKFKEKIINAKAALGYILSLIHI